MFWVKQRKTILLALLALMATPCLAQEEQSFSSERPSFSASPIALASSLWQFEAGYLYSDVFFGSEQTFPNSLLRYGLPAQVELQLAWTGYSRSSTESGSLTGVTDAELGLKWQVTGEGAAINIGLFGGISLPVGDSELSSDDYDPRIGLYWSHDASGIFGGVTDTYRGSKHLWQTGLGWSFSLPKNIGSYIEWQAAFPEDDHNRHSLATALTWMVAPKTQLDVNAALGLNSAASDYVLGAGLAVRW